MTAKRRLVPLTEVKEALEFLRQQGVAIEGVDIRADGVTFFPANQTSGSAYDRWKAKDKGNARSAHRS